MLIKQLIGVGIICCLLSPMAMAVCKCQARGLVEEAAIKAKTHESCNCTEPKTCKPLNT